uniref:thiol oxidase n=1 Tax=viral metagenome TaxID=1070528 RepID=A0A6C0HTA5_9ZZZZ
MDTFVFNNKDYKSGDGMLTSIWGPALWHFLHTMSFNYPINPTKSEKIQYMNFIKSLEYVLPCKYCRTNLKKNFIELPLRKEDMKSRGTFSKYVYNLHEHINKMLGKTSNLSYEDIRETYEHFRARCTSNSQKKESGCVKPMHGEKSKCILRIVPQIKKTKSFSVDKKCFKRLTKRRKTI